MPGQFFIVALFLLDMKEHINITCGKATVVKLWSPTVERQLT